MLIIGHSHIECIEEAARERGAPVTVVNLWGVPDPVVGEGGDFRLSDHLRAVIEGDVISVIGGGAQHVMSLNPHPNVFDFVLPEAPDLPLVEGAAIMPVDQARATLESIAEEDLQLLPLIAGATQGRTIHLLPPPPVREESPIDHPMWHARVGRSTKISPASFRMKVHRLHAVIMAEACAAAGVTLLPPPPEALDAEGYLRPELWGRPCHANARYGAMVLDQLQGLAA